MVLATMKNESSMGLMHVGVLATSIRVGGYASAHKTGRMLIQELQPLKARIDVVLSVVRPSGLASSIHEP